MSKQRIKKTNPPLAQRVAKVERTLKTLLRQHQGVKPQKLDPKPEADQVKHQSALASFQTERGISMNTHPDHKADQD